MCKCNGMYVLNNIMHAQMPTHTYLHYIHSFLSSAFFSWQLA